jgi:ribonucleotide reductase alpha subunit
MPEKLKFERYFTQGNASAFASVDWKIADAVIKNREGEVIFEHKSVEVPAFWDQSAINIVAEKYFRVINGVKETSAKQMFERVAETIAHQGNIQGLFASLSDAQTFKEELLYILVNGMFAFNSPVWFNIGVPGVKQQASACFIQLVNDEMPSITSLQTKEVMLFKGGSGTGSNLSNLRSSYEGLSNGGIASGPVSFMEGFDAWAGVTKSGGGTRRAAKMVILNYDHPDILEQKNGRPGFITCKQHAEKMAHDLIDIGYPGEFHLPGNVYEKVGFQNANNSVRVSDGFMQKAADRQTYQTKKILTGEPVHTYKADEILEKIAFAAWFCGDPGLQFDDTINKWHTCKDSGRINASNPCCFVGETLVDTSEGRIPIAKLAELSANGDPLPYAFSFNKETGVPALRPIVKAWKAGDAKKLVRVTTERGLSFLCTPEHRFLTYSGEYVEAQHLTSSTRLRKVNRTINEQRSNRRSILMKSVNGRDTFIQSRWMWEQAFGPIPEGFDVHHKNEDPTDDRLSNFELRAITEHRSEHAVGEANPRFIDLPLTQIVEVWEAIEAIPRKTHKNAEPVTPTRWNAYVKANNLKGTVPLAQSPSTGGHIHGMPWAEFAQYVHSLQAMANDRVASVTHIDVEPTPVFDIEVLDTHNFGIGSVDSRHSIIVSNSEYMFLDDTACNLGSFNLLRFLKGKEFQTHDFIYANEVCITAMEILVGFADYPSKEIHQNSLDFRPLGIGYANLGALLMSMGYAYDSTEGRSVAAAVTSLMSGASYTQSARMAEAVGAFPLFEKNRDSMLDVIEMHLHAAKSLTLNDESNETLLEQAKHIWVNALTRGVEWGFRNSQISVLAPTGTISFLMMCDTTGIEPMTFLAAIKKLVGGGSMKLVNGAVRRALLNLGYAYPAVLSIENKIAETDKFPADDVLAQHRKVFQTAIGAKNEAISVSGHIHMMAAVQPFLSGAISKTVNMPADSTVDEVREAYVQAWKLGLKAIAIYRDGCKRSQPLNKVDKKKEEAGEPVIASETPPVATSAWGNRIRLPDDRKAIIHKFNVGGQEGYLHVGMYEDGKPGEIFIDVSKAGSTLHGVFDMWATSMSIGLQHGVPLKSFLDKFEGMQFEPRGFTRHEHIHIAQSLGDYIARYLKMRFYPEDAPVPTEVVETQAAPVKTATVSYDGPPCSKCGSVMQRSGTCYRCPNCFETTGCG